MENLTLILTGNEKEVLQKYSILMMSAAFLKHADEPSLTFLLYAVLHFLLIPRRDLFESSGKL